MKNSKKETTAIIEWADGLTTVRTYRTVEEMLDEISLAKMLNAKTCIWFKGTGWIWS